jgi:hypothetical protein
MMTKCSTRPAPSCTPSLYCGLLRTRFNPVTVELEVEVEVEFPEFEASGLEEEGAVGD